MRDCNCSNSTELIGVIRDHMAFPERGACTDYEHWETIRHIIDTLIVTVNGKAEQSSLDNIVSILSNKASADNLMQAIAMINDKISRTELSEMLKSTITRADIENLFKEE